MSNRATIQTRYLRDEPPVRLGGLAANLARIKSFSDHPDHRDVVERLLEESKFMIEWTARDTALDVQAELVELQVQLSCWQYRWQDIWVDPEKRASVAQLAGAWSQRVLKLSGLAD